jgi:hypothetical protein
MSSDPPVVSDAGPLIEQLHLNLAEVARRQDIWINPALVERLLDEIVED